MVEEAKEGGKMKDEDLWKHLLKYKGISSVLDDQFDDSITSGTKG